MIFEKMKRRDKDANKRVANALLIQVGTYLRFPVDILPKLQRSWIDFTICLI